MIKAQSNGLFGILGMKPEAHIAVNKNRLSEKNGKVYVKDGTEFQIELFNPTTLRVGVEIKLNGSLISNSLLVLNQGERVFLDRFIDNNKKFLFKTYQVEDGNSIVDNAIANNGAVEINFFYEEIKRGINANITWINPYTLTNSSGGFVYETKSTNINGLADINTYFSSTLDFSPEMDILSLSAKNPRSFSKKAKMKETGRVDEGSDSNQKLTKVNIEFCDYPFHTETLQVLPISQKPIESSNIRVYCTECGTKQKSSWKFCPTCGKRV